MTKAINIFPPDPVPYKPREKEPEISKWMGERVAELMEATAEMTPQQRSAFYKFQKRLFALTPDERDRLIDAAMALYGDSIIF